MDALKISTYSRTKKGISIVLIMFLSISLFVSGAASSICCCETSCDHCLKVKQALENAELDSQAHVSHCCTTTQGIVNNPGECRSIDISNTTAVVKPDRQTNLLWQSGLDVETCSLLHPEFTMLKKTYPEAVAGSAPIYYFTMTFLC